MRVVMIHQHDPSASHVGGIQTFLNTFIKYAPADFEIRLVGVTTDPRRNPVGLWRNLEAGGRPFRFLPVISAQPNYHGAIPITLRLAAGVRRHGRQIPFEGSVIELHRVEPALVLGSLKNPKVLFLHAHPMDLHNPKSDVIWGKFPPAYFWLERPLMRQMSRVYIVRADGVEFYQRRYRWLRERVSFLPTWVDEEVFVSLPEAERARARQALAQTHRIDPAARWLLFVGRFDGQKDPLYLLESFRRLNGRAPNAQLILVGEGLLEPQMRAFIAGHGLGSRVHLVGPQQQMDLARWMNSSDCLVMSSAFEGMPRVVVESLHCGLPVVTTVAGETPRLIGDSSGGRLVRERTPEAFVAAVTDLLAKPPSRESCRRQAAPFTARAILSPVYETYRRLTHG